MQSNAGINNNTYRVPRTKDEAVMAISAHDCLCDDGDRICGDDGGFDGSFCPEKEQPRWLFWPTMDQTTIVM